MSASNVVVGHHDDSSGLILDQTSDLVALYRQRLAASQLKVESLTRQLQVQREALSQQSDLQQKVQTRQLEAQQSLALRKSIEADQRDLYEEGLRRLRTQVEDRDKRIRELEEQIRRDRDIFERTLRVVRDQEVSASNQSQTIEMLKRELEEAKGMNEKLRKQYADLQRRSLGEVESERMKHRQELFVLQRMINNNNNGTAIGKQ
eukprot:ANDGO_07381.mRNA.1 hypothetical protein